MANYPEKPKVHRPIRKPKSGTGQAQRAKIEAWSKRDGGLDDRIAEIRAMPAVIH